MTAVADPADDATAMIPWPTGGRRPAGGTIRPSRPIGGAVPGYEILGELGRGGMGVVYKARHPKLEPRRRPEDDPGRRARRARRSWPGSAIEAEAVARLQHPNIVQIYEVGEHDGLPYFALEFVDGGSLAEQHRRHAAAAARGGRGLVEPLRPRRCTAPTPRRSSTAT